MSESQYDYDIHERAIRHVGVLEALDAMASRCGCMPCDKTTAALLDAIKSLTNKAILSAWEYSSQYRPPKAERAT